jgi:hypothetical protein
MSLSYQRLTPVAVLDPLTDVQTKRDYSILKGGDKISFKAFTSTSVSSSSIQFSCPPPNGSVFTSRKQYFQAPVRLIFTGLITTTDPTYVPLTSLLNANFDSPRAYPLSGSMESLTLTINNTQMSSNIGDYIHALIRYNIDSKLKNKDYSLTPDYPDQSLNYSDLHGSIRSPLAFYGDGLDGSPTQRGAFPFTILPTTNVAVIPTVAGTIATATVDMVCCEPLFLSPLCWGHNDTQGLYNVNSLDYNISFYNNLGNRMWSHDAITPVSNNPVTGASVFSSITNITVQFNGFNPAFSYNDNQPRLLFKYVTPNLLTSGLTFNTPITYPYFNPIVYTTDIGTIAYSPTSLPGSGVTVTTNNIQISSIPRRFYLWVRPSNQALLNSPNLTDCFLSITNVAVQWDANSVLMSSANQQQLYLMNVKNHGDFTWQQWSGYPGYNAAFPPNTGTGRVTTTGGPICMEFGTDLQLGPDQSCGMQGQYNLQVTLQVQNLNSTGAWDTVPLSILMLVVQEGTFTVSALGQSIAQLGVISKQDILDAKRSPFINYHDIQAINGGDFFSGLKDFGSRINQFLKDSKLISTLAPLIPGIGGPASQIARNLGYGYDGEGVMAGGKKLSKAQLRKALEYR